MEPVDFARFKSEETERMHIRADNWPKTNGTTWSILESVVAAVRPEAAKQNVECGKLVGAILWQALEDRQ
jgi:hypothetical protein